MATRYQIMKARQARREAGLLYAAWLKDENTGRKCKFYAASYVEAEDKATAVAEKWHAAAVAAGEQTVDRFYMAVGGDGWSSLYLEG